MSHCLKLSSPGLGYDLNHSTITWCPLSAAGLLICHLLHFVNCQEMITWPSYLLKSSCHSLAVCYCSTWLTTHLGNMLIWCYCMAKLGAMGGLLVTSMWSIFLTARHLHTSQLLQMVLALLRSWAQLSMADPLHWWSEVHQGTCYKFPQQPCFGWWKPVCYVPPWLSAMLQFQHGGRLSGWMCYWASFFHLISPVMRTWIFLNTYCMGSWKICHFMCIRTCGFSTMVHSSFYLYGSRSSGSKIWANVDRSWWPDCLASMFTWPESARLLPVRPHEELGLRDLFDSEEDLMAWIMAEADIGLQDIGDRVYENMVRRYRVYVEVAGCHIKPFL